MTHRYWAGGREEKNGCGESINRQKVNRENSLIPNAPSLDERFS